MKILRNVLLGVVILVAVLGVIVVYWTRAPLPQHSGTLQIEGLNDTVTIIRDEYGVPHIYASNLYDLRFAQGYVQAQDRWWQMEFWRHTGRGQIQELTGQNPEVASNDIFIRTIGFEETARNDLETMADDVRAELEYFSDGVNAYIADRQMSQLAFEYSILGLIGIEFDVEPWTPLDTVVWTKVMAWDLSSSNYSNERIYSAIAGEFGDEMASDYFPDFNFDEYPTIVFPEDLPDVGEPFNPPLDADNNDSVGIRGIGMETAGNFDPSTGLLFGSGDGIGSNNWVVSGELTNTGMPLLANDPHLGIQNPSIWYEVGLYCTEVSEECPYRTRGFAFASSPGIVLGHNERIGWGVTNVGPDVLDLYALEINPENDFQYLWNGEWRDMTTRQEVINFGEGGSITITVRETHIGPILNDNQIDEETGELLGFNNEDPVAVRYTASEDGTIIEALMRLNRARNWDEFREAISYWDMPAQNIVYADIEGNIGYQTSGRLPIRAEGHTGAMPVDGTVDDYEWLGFVPYEYMPSIYNPERGYISTANQALLPLEYYNYLADELGDEFGENANYVFDLDWAMGYRGARIDELLTSFDTHTIETFQTIHRDNRWLFAEDISPYLSDLDMGSDELNEMRDWMLTDWDYHMDANSSQGALFGLFFEALVTNTYGDELAVIDREPDGSDQSMYMTFLLLDDPENPWWDDLETDDIVETAPDIVTASFAEATDVAVSTLGDNRDDWAWGAIHTTTFVSNPLGASGIGLIEDFVNISDIQTSGGTAIVNATSWRIGEDVGLPVRAIPSMRMILDFSDYANNLTIHSTGQSGHPASPMHSSMTDVWATLGYNPMLWFAEESDASVVNVLILDPID